MRNQRTRKPIGQEKRSLMDGPVEDIDADADPHEGARGTAFLKASVSTIESGVSFIESYGWFILIGTGLCLYIWYNHLRGNLKEWRRQRADAAGTVDLKKFDRDAFIARQEAMELARRRQQAELEEKLMQAREEARKREEQKRQEKIEDWERHVEGLGYRSRHHGDEASVPASDQKVSHIPTKKKANLRGGDYNPLSGGGGGGGGYRPSRKGCGPSGGG